MTGITGYTLRSYLCDYQESGIERLKQLNFYQPQSQPMEHRESLEEYFKANPPATIQQARRVIAEQTGIERSPTRVRGFLLHLGLKCRKVGMISAKADLEKQAPEFLEQELEPRLEEAQRGEC